jgi:protoporphyrinogen/coproporphyrinogen III oxidase
VSTAGETGERDRDTMDARVTNDRPRRVAVIGAGISGLVAAHHLRTTAPDTEVVVLERDDRAGGMVHTEHWQGRVIEHGPEGFVTNRPEALELVDELGLGDQLVVGGPAPRRTFVARGDDLVPLPYGVLNPDRTAAADLLRSPLLSMRGRLRLMAEPFVPRRRDPADESVASFVRRRFGAELLEALVEPLIGGIHGSSTDELSAEMLVPALRRIELDGGSVALAALRRRRGRRRLGPRTDAGAVAAHTTSNRATDTSASRSTLLTSLRARAASVARSAGVAAPSGTRPSAAGSTLPPLVSLRDGMASLTDAIAAELGDALQLGVGVATIRPLGGPGAATTGWELTLGDGRCLVVDGLVLATPPAVTGALLRPLDPEVATSVASMPWGSSTTVTLIWDADDVPPLEMGTGYLVAGRDGGRVAACTFTTAKWHHRSVDGAVMIRCFLRGVDAPAPAGERTATEGTATDEPHRDGLHGDAATTDRALVALARGELARRIGLTADPSRTIVERVPIALPVMTVGHRGRVRTIHERVARLGPVAVAGAGLEGAGLPACIRSGRLAADAVVQSLDRSPTAAAPS